MTCRECYPLLKLHWICKRIHPVMCRPPPSAWIFYLNIIQHWAWKCLERFVSWIFSKIFLTQNWRASKTTHRAVTYLAFHHCEFWDKEEKTVRSHIQSGGRLPFSPFPLLKSRTEQQLIMTMGSFVAWNQSSFNLGPFRERSQHLPLIANSLCAKANAFQMSHKSLWSKATAGSLHWKKIGLFGSSVKVRGA